jgi:hypothetical protein
VHRVQLVQKSAQQALPQVVNSGALSASLIQHSRSVLGAEATLVGKLQQKPRPQGQPKSCREGLDRKGPHRLMCWRLGPQLGVLFLEVVEALGGPSRKNQEITGGLTLKAIPARHPLSLPLATMRWQLLSHTPAAMMFCLASGPKQWIQPP